jgi:hypothetical protein
MISPTPAVHSSLDVIASRMFGYDDNVPNSGNLERLNLDNILEPLGDIAYHTYVTPHIEAMTDFWSHPSIESGLHLAHVGLTSALPMGAFINLLDSPTARQGIWTSAQDLVGGIGQFAYGAIDLHASGIDYSMAVGASSLINATDTWPIPHSWEHTIDSGAEWFIDRIENGMIPGVNIPLLPLF